MFNAFSVAGDIAQTYQESPGWSRRKSREASVCAKPPPGVQGLPEPLKYQVPGRIFNVDPETCFDTIFRRFGAGSFEDRYLQARQGKVVSDPAPQWDPPAPELGDWEEAVAQGVISKRKVRVERTAQLPAWVPLWRKAKTITSDESWSLHLLDEDEGFWLNVDSTLSGVPYCDCFVVHARYRATALKDGDETQLDLEFQLEWIKSAALLRSQIEEAFVSAIRRGFEEAFLPVACGLLSDSEGLPPVVGKAAASPQPLASFRMVSGQTPERLAETLESGGDQAPSSLAAEYAEDWSGSLHGFELRIEVLGASNLNEPEYRLGDFTAALIGTPSLQAVYVELQLGSRKVRTECAENHSNSDSVSFSQERMLFVYNGEEKVGVTVRDHRGVQALLRGDPLVGAGTLTLPQGVRDCLPHWADVPLFSNEGEDAGEVALRYQRLLVEGRGVTMPAEERSLLGPAVLHPDEEADAAADAAMPERTSVKVRLAFADSPDTLAFHTPPGSPRLDCEEGSPKCAY